MRIFAKTTDALGPSIRRSLMTIAALVLFVFVGTQLIGTAQEMKKAQGSKITSNADLIARGKYIVEGVAACSDCHTPRGESGESDHSKWLAGAPVFFQPAKPIPGWPRRLAWPDPRQAATLRSSHC